MKGSATALVRILLLLRTKIRSMRDEEYSVKCVGTEISWVRLYSSMSSVTLLLLFCDMSMLKSPVMIISTILVFHALSTLALIKLKYSGSLLGGYKIRRQVPFLTEHGVRSKLIPDQLILGQVFVCIIMCHGYKPPRLHPDDLPCQF